jgi:hypothetical protein
MSDIAEAVAPPDAAAAQFEKRTKQYIEVRDKIREISERHSEELKPFVEIQNALTAWLTENLDKVGAKSIKTTQGTVYQSTRYSAALSDPKAFMDHVIETQNWNLLDRKANSTAVRDYVEQNKFEPPGVRLSAIRTVGVRRASDK